MTQPTVFLTVAETVERLATAGIDVTPETVRQWARTKKLQHIQLPGGQYRFPADAIDAISKVAAA